MNGVDSEIKVNERILIVDLTFLSYTDGRSLGPAIFYEIVSTIDLHY